MPHEANKIKFEKNYALLLANVTGTTKTYFESLYSKKEQWCKAFKKENSLETYSTGIVENVNKLLKEHVNSQCTLNDYLYRMLKFTSNLNNNNGMGAEEVLQYNSYYNHLSSSAFLINVKSHITEFALMRTVLCMMKSFNWVTTKTHLELQRADNHNIRINLKRIDNKLDCKCGFYLSLHIPCEHILKFLTEFKQEEQIMQYYDSRWHNINLINDDSLIDYLEKIIQDERKNTEENNRQRKDEIFQDYIDDFSYEESSREESSNEEILNSDSSSEHSLSEMYKFIHLD